MEQLTPEAIDFIKKNNRLFFEITEAWGKHRGTIDRWLLQNRRPELSHPKTITIIRKFKPGKIQIIANK